MIPLHSHSHSSSTQHHHHPYSKLSQESLLAGGGSTSSSTSTSSFITFEKVTSNLRLIWGDPSSRNLFLFLCLNLSFAFVELFYGIVTNSLGLISDSFHMFFDCTGLVAGLAASIITKWKATPHFSYGYVRAEVLAGFVNGLFLLFIAFFIFSEAVERALEPPEVKHERLFVVSVLGFIVNLVGIYAFQHGHSHGGGGGHGHSHGGGGGHGHSHSSHDHGHDGHSHSYSNGLHSQLPNGYNTSSTTLQMDMEDSINELVHSNATAKNSQIMRGVFLHILADTLGSVGVIISAILMWAFGWMIADPICSMFIAIMISVSVIGLIKESGLILMQRQPRELDNLLPGIYQRITNLDGVISLQEAHFWTLSSDNYVGAVKLEVERGADPRYIIAQAQANFTSIGVKQVHIQLDHSMT